MSFVLNLLNMTFLKTLSGDVLNGCRTEEGVLSGSYN